MLLLFHDHEWEQALFVKVVPSAAFYIGAQGGENARITRILSLASNGITETDIARIRSPVGLTATASCLRLWRFPHWLKS